MAFPLLLAKQVFINEDGTTGTLYLVTSDLTLTYDRMTSLYQKRFRVEGYHKSLKQNASLEKSPTRTETTQQNHFFASVCAYVKAGTVETQAGSQPFRLKVKDLSVGFEVRLCRTCQAQPAVPDCVTSVPNLNLRWRASLQQKFNVTVEPSQNERINARLRAQSRCLLLSAQTMLRRPAQE